MSEINNEKECQYPYLKALRLKKGSPLLWNDKILNQDKSSTAADYATLMMIKKKIF